MNAPMIFQSFFSLPKGESVGVVLPPKTLKSNEWMAKWQEQEDGIVRNFSIIVLAQRLVSERVRKGSLYTLGGQEK